MKTHAFLQAYQKVQQQILNVTGYRSCMQAVKLETTSNANIDCFGSFSCYNADIIRRSDSSTEWHIGCKGMLGCAQVNLIHNANGNIDCQGEQACAGSKIYLPNENYLHCNGALSCVDSTVDFRGRAWLLGDYLA